MALRFLLKRALPSALVFLGLVAGAILLDVVLHLLKLAPIGRSLGLVGTAVIVLSFAYSLRKRKWITVGQPKRLLTLHEIMGWVGALLLLVHGGIHFHAVIPWLALLLLLVVVGSGLTGKYLLKDARDSLKGREAELQAKGLDKQQVERELLGHALLVRKMQNWRKVHMPLTMILTGLALVHIVTTILMGSWF